MGVCAGVDWAKDEHAVLVADESGETLFEGVVDHDEAGIERLCRTLCALEVERVALERPDGLLVERLLAAGRRVLALHPNQVKAARARFRVAGGKSDRFDAFVLCELARTDAHRFRALVPDADETKALRALTRAREDLVGQRVAVANQLRAELERFWPGALRVFAESTRRSPSPSSSAIQVPQTRVASASAASLSSSHAAVTRVASARRSCSGACAGRRWAAPVTPRRRPAELSCSPS